jgi:AcrR family transcriptional regulator
LNNIARVPKRAPRSRSASRRRAKPAPAPERILSAALSAFAERGFEGATTREIAAAAGVPHGLITYHYESKQALWEAAVDRSAELARISEAPSAALGDVDPSRAGAPHEAVRAFCRAASRTAA